MNLKIHNINNNKFNRNNNNHRNKIKIGLFNNTSPSHYYLVKRNLIYVFMFYVLTIVN